MEKYKLQKENINYIFKEKPAIYNYDLKHIANIQKNYEEHRYIQEKDVQDFINFFITNVRKKKALPFDPTEYSYRGQCGRTELILNDVFTRMGIKANGLNIGDMFTEDISIHQIEIITIPVLTENKIIQKKYLLDPTFRQFCIDEENRFERYYEEPRYAANMSTPHPGYFLNMKKNKRQFANNLIKEGYFEMTDDNIKKYFDAFILYLRPKEDYINPNQIGKIDETSYTANYYKSLINSNLINKNELTISKEEKLKTPIELLNKEKISLLKKFKEKLKNNNNWTKEINIPPSSTEEKRSNSRR